MSAGTAGTAGLDGPLGTVSTSGDSFVRDEVLQAALRAELGEDLSCVATTSRWPDEPWGEIDGVDEACGSVDALIEGLAGVQVAITHVAPFTRQVFRAAPQLRYVGVGRGGPVNIDLDAAREAGVVVANAPGRNAVGVAEMTIGLLLSACKRLAESDGILRLPDHRWPGELYRYEQAGLEVEGTTVGLVGFGAIGHRVGRILRAFGAHVLVFDPYVDQRIISYLDCEPVATLDELLQRSQVLSLHPRVTGETRGMIGADELARLPEGAVLVNSARGPLLDYDALCDALDSGRLRAAGLDTYAVEPIPADSRLYRTPNLTMTPHIAGATRQSADKAAAMVAADLRRWLAGEPLRYPVLVPGST